MKNLIVLAVAALFATNAVAAEMKWTGSTGWRYHQISQDDQLDSKNNASEGKDVSTEKTRAHAIRANLGVMGGWENVEYGVGVRTGGNGAGPKNTDWVSVNNSGDLALAIDQAWFRYVRDFGSVDFAATVGRQKTALATDSTWETLFDNDIRFDGFGWNLKFGMFGFNAAQYVLGASQAGGGTGNSTYTYTEASENIATTHSRFSMLYAFQPHMTWKFSDEIEAMFAVAMYKYDTRGFTNAIGGAARTVSATNGGTVPAVSTGATYAMDNKTQWDFLAKVALPYSLNFTANLVKNSSAAYNEANVAGYTGATNASDVRRPEVSATAWTLGLTYGKLRKAQDFSLGYAYGTKGIGSVLSGYTNEFFPADMKGHTVVAGYAVADNFNIGLRWINLKEKERITTITNTHANGSGLPYGTSAAGVSGVNNNQMNKISHWELTAGVAF